MSESQSRDLTVPQELAQKRPQFQAALRGTGIDEEKFVRVVMTAINLNPDLLRCERRSLMNAALRAAQDGLLPDGRDGALVPFMGKVSWMPMISGIRQKVRRSGDVAGWDVHAVHAKDAFDYQLGDEPYIHHKPWMPEPIEPQREGESNADFRERLRKHVNPGPLVYVYSVATLKGGHRSYDVMSCGEVELTRDEYARKNAKGEFSPAWRKSFGEMAKKTVARRHSKVLPMSTDIVALLHRDDELYDLERERGERIQAPRDLSKRLDLVAGFDPETGEVNSGAGFDSLASGSAASDDPGIGAGEEAAQLSEAPAVEGGGIENAAQLGEPVGAPAADSTAPPGEPAPPSEPPGGQPELISRPSIEEEGLAKAKQGKDQLESWLNELPADVMAKVSLAQVKAWRGTADKVKKK